MVYFVNISSLNTNLGNVHQMMLGITLNNLMRHTRHVESTDTAKSLVLDWETKLQPVNSYMYITPSDNDSLEEDNNADNKREEWMLMAELNIQTNDFMNNPHLYNRHIGIRYINISQQRKSMQCLRG